jgi:hypothetical protein
LTKFGAAASNCRPFSFARSLPDPCEDRWRQNLPCGCHPAEVGKDIMNYVLVFFGGGLGATLRHVVNMTCARCIGTAFPYGTFIINITARS